MHNVVGNQKAITKMAEKAIAELSNPDSLTKSAIASASLDVNSTLAHLREVHRQVSAERSHDDIHFVSRIGIVGLFQAALASAFSYIPELQGLGDRNPGWIASKIDEWFHDASDFFTKVHQVERLGGVTLAAALISQLKALETANFRFPFPATTPEIVKIDKSAFKIALLADWGGDNPAAIAVGEQAKKQNPDFAIHLGDIYYGGAKWECERFLEVWPWSTKQLSGAIPWAPPKGMSFALNGNHEMYSGGQWYCQTVLPAFGQSHSFFCLMNDYWRIIGIDTAYSGGRLNPETPNDLSIIQLAWLKALLSIDDKRANIILSHHQPISAHGPEFTDCLGLKQDVENMLNQLPPARIDSIFGWFFGHEHRCIIYKDKPDFPRFNARLIGNGCIPHSTREIDYVPGAAEPLAVNHRETEAGSGSAISSFALLSFGGSQLKIDYINQDDSVFGSELWDTQKGRLHGEPFDESDESKQLIRKA